MWMIIVTRSPSAYPLSPTKSHVHVDRTRSCNHLWKRRRHRNTTHIPGPHRHGWRTAWEVRLALARASRFLTQEDACTLSAAVCCHYRITGVSYAAARANGFREASLCCALCAQRGPHIGQTLHSSAVGWRVMEVAPARTFTYKFAAAEGVLLCSAFLIIEAEAEHCS